MYVSRVMICYGIYYHRYRYLIYIIIKCKSKLDIYMEAYFPNKELIL